MRPRDRELIHLLVIALLQIDDLALRRAADQNHGKAVRGSIRERGKAVEESRSRNGQADAGPPGQKARDGCRIACVLLMAEGDHAHARGLRLAAQIGDRNAGHAVDGLDAVEFQRVDDEVKPIGQFAFFGWFVVCGLCCCGHSAPSLDAVQSR